MAETGSSTAVRLVLVFVLRLLAMALAGWIALAPQALPGAHPVTRAGLAAMLLVFSLLLGEVDKLRTQFDALLRALRRATGTVAEGGDAADGAAASSATAEAVPILIRALDSQDADVREKAHKNLVRITGRTELGAERSAWERWWATHGATGEEDPRS